MELKRQIGLITAVLIIVADMIGTGIFTTTGYTLIMTAHPGFLLLSGQYLPGFYWARYSALRLSLYS